MGFDSLPGICLRLTSNIFMYQVHVAINRFRSLRSLVYKTDSVGGGSLVLTFYIPVYLVYASLQP